MVFHIESGLFRYSGVEKSVTTTRCSYLNCCQKCKLAKKALTTNPELVDLFLFMDVVDTAIECNDCALACSYYNYIHKNINKYDCGC